MANWQKPETLAIWLSVGVSLVLFLVIVLVLFTRVYIRRILAEQKERANLKLDYQKELLKDSIRVQERERDRISADLHDGLISKLNVLLLTMHADDRNENARVLLRDSIGIARRISHDLSPPLLSETDLQDLIADFITPLKSVMDVRFYLSVHSERHVDDDVKLQLFRVVQEIVSNAIKHAKAEMMEVSLRITDKYVSLRLADNGIGFNMDKKSRGLGQKNIELRIQMLKGKYRLRSKSKEGTVFLLHIPV
jgi:two-component system, NarL family, sensor kinase